MTAVLLTVHPAKHAQMKLEWIMLNGYHPPDGLDPVKWTKLLEESATYCEVENVVFCDSRRSAETIFPTL